MGGGYTYLNKKSEHTERFDNIQKVWLAEQKEDERKRNYEIRKKKLQDEKDAYELKKIKVAKGLLPKIELEKIDFLYNQNNTTTDNYVDDFLIGKNVSTNNLKNKILKQENNNTDIFEKNEDFVRTYEDPLYYIKKEEIKFNNSRNINNNGKKIKKDSEIIDRLLQSKLNFKNNKSNINKYTNTISKNNIDIIKQRKNELLNKLENIKTNKNNNIFHKNIIADINNDYFERNKLKDHMKNNKFYLKNKFNK